MSGAADNTTAHVLPKNSFTEKYHNTAADTFSSLWTLHVARLRTEELCKANGYACGNPQTFLAQVRLRA